ncbi:hypothetical protein L249_6356 [Ophiocordyceps polyrhachis-furcata BCC 54312]|uniref:Uncharacterized protein n=1 Tax=Ophiocordyceps polyrhachis-furcata BCC 54312 TaxID=1330021 RepID=A0A367L123_9HYPO|nr:hypothetical protein L249_6356 [Ophiocordyceps polyrhachis-furcata BCC 54312]
MAVISVVKRAPHEHNWAYREPGVVLVFCIVFLVAVGVLSLFAYRLIQKRKERKPSNF